MHFFLFGWADVGLLELLVRFDFFLSSAMASPSFLAFINKLLRVTSIVKPTCIAHE